MEKGKFTLCSSCGRSATHECSEYVDTNQICGASLCEDCVHVEKHRHENQKNSSKKFGY